jgi:hypothetical protein
MDSGNFLADENSILCEEIDGIKHQLERKQHLN